MDEARGGGDTRKLLKIFGVAATQFEERSAEVLERLRTHQGPADAELLAAVGAIMTAVADTNEKWQRVTDHLFAAQRDALSEMAERLSEIEPR